MGKQGLDGISWTHFTFNTWWGCVEVSPACDFCYARELANRFGHHVWGKDAPRRFFAEAHWREPEKWNRDAEKRGQRARVFCGSMMDICERRPDTDAERLKLWPLIRRTPWLDWLLLTKRPQEFRHILPPEWLTTPQPNVWLMTTIESAEYWWRWRELSQIKAVVRAISYEPALGPIRLNRNGLLNPAIGATLPHMIIAGDESGVRARPSDHQWYRDLRGDCEDLGVAFHMKQLCLEKRGKPSPFPMFPAELQVRQYPGGVAHREEAAS